eukprot:scaffold23151_cov117-Isochrysis_galbana.AAC.6
MSSRAMLLTATRLSPGSTPSRCSNERCSPCTFHTYNMPSDAPVAIVASSNAQLIERIGDPCVQSAPSCPSE